MDYKTLKKHYGTQMAIARALNVGQTTVASWKRAGRIPLEHQVAAEVHSKRAVRADLPPAVRRP